MNSYLQAASPGCLKAFFFCFPGSPKASSLAPRRSCSVSSKVNRRYFFCKSIGKVFFPSLIFFHSSGKMQIKKKLVKKTSHTSFLYPPIPPFPAPVENQTQNSYSSCSGKDSFPYCPFVHFKKYSRALSVLGISGLLSALCLQTWYRKVFHPVYWTLL